MGVPTPPPEDDSDFFDYGTGTIAPPVSTGAISVRIAAGLKIIADLQVRDVTNTLRPIQEGVIRTATGLKRIFGRLTAVAPASVTGSRNSTNTVKVTTGTATVAPFGGSSPYTYAWTRTDGGPHSWTITSPTAQATTFSSNVAAHATEVATFRVTVTDKLGVTATADVAATTVNGTQ